VAIEKISIEKYLELASRCPVIDVRSPGEFSHAHIPGAYSLPLFSDEERKIVGTAYKQESRERAIKIGLDFFGTKMRAMIEKAEAISVEELTVGKVDPPGDLPRSKTLLLYCWRGGMRSAGVAWLLDLYGFKVYTLKGGYKSFRRYVLDSFKKDYPFRVLGGYTGSGKTEVLESLKKCGQAVVDLEGLAKHKGSAFGNIGMPPQPSQEMFENLLSRTLEGWHAGGEATRQFIWIEDESQRIGNLNIPGDLWRTMRNSPIYFLDIPFEERLKHIVAEYGKLDQERMVNAIIRIQKRLGSLETRNSINYLLENNVGECFRTLLTYYDRWYLKSLHNRENLNTLLHKIPCKTTGGDNAAFLLNQYQI
jgi:tRNA 2-selenouridine synthase